MGTVKNNILLILCIDIYVLVLGNDSKFNHD